ncbi:hypothetical protein K2173_012128 [Erythroxylum novogranatense]|uniref:NAC domain-containing protein n=1 Tax=Erythroxylum novogranatense TaxID=1862640 RepID=A0AAV8SS80_9ROSI|nr:hypothetical protein K2173_012128 [Erythroxylum novogranatense]
MEDWPPGFRFYPTEEELVSFYLRNKLEAIRDDLNQLIDRIIPTLDIYEFNPWELPQFSGEVRNRDPEQWFFFIPRQESEAKGGRPRRQTSTGYWKATGSPAHVFSNNQIIGMKRTMVFYMGRAPSGQKTEWKMNEYKLIMRGEASPSAAAAHTMLRQEFSLCRVYKNSKNLRAFDRRPPGPEMVETRAQPVGGYDGTITSCHHYHEPPVVERASSPESSSSGDQGNVSQTAESSSKAMSRDNDMDLSWDWEQLEWK